MRRFACWSIVFAIVLLMAGCSRGPRRGAVAGTILVGGEPLAEGAIDFFPTDGPHVGDVVKDGHYAIPAERGPIVGENVVRIRGFRKSGRKIPDIWAKGKMIDELISAVPDEFNARSTLKREIHDGMNVLDFDIPATK